jgi:hypothetical protein
MPAKYPNTTTHLSSPSLFFSLPSASLLFFTTGKQGFPVRLHGKGSYMHGKGFAVRCRTVKVARQCASPTLHGSATPYDKGRFFAVCQTYFI